MPDDFDLANTRPGFCPECFQKANIWNATQNHWECSYCNWAGRHPLPTDPREKYGENK